MYDDNLSALRAFSQGVALTAHNVANVNTDGFDPVSFAYGAGPTVPGPVGFAIGNVQLQPTPPALVPRSDSVTLFAASPEVADSVGWYMPPVYSNTDVTREMVNLMVAENGFAANAETIAQRALTEQDALSGLFVNRTA